MDPETRTGVPAHIAATSALLVVVLVHLIGQLFVPSSFATQASQVLLMPALAGVLYAATSRPRPLLVKLGLLALFFSWLGDTVPRFLSGDAGFLAMVGGFLLAQAVYVIALWPYRSRSIAAKPLLVAPYVAVAIALLSLCVGSAGALAVPITIYAGVIVAMAVLATGLSFTAACGGAVFLLSDSLIALNAFADVTLPGHGFWVMVTYVLGQSLLVQAIIRQSEQAQGLPLGRP